MVEIERRIKSSNNPDVYTAIGLLSKAIASGGVDRKVLSLVHLRASQINACAACIYATITSAKKNGETDERLHAVAAWREAPFFTDEERAALEFAEAATRLQDGGEGVTDEIWDKAADYFTEEQLNAIILEIALTNFYNRINRTVREPAGKTWA